MNKNEMIIEVINLYDENERLKNEINILIGENDSISEPKGKNDISYMDKLMIEQGKEEVLKKVLCYTWRCVNASYDEETNTYKVTSYKEWLKEKMNRNNLPDKMSLDDFRTYFRKELQEMYEKEKEEAIRNKKAKREENE